MKKLRIKEIIKVCYLSLLALLLTFSATAQDSLIVKKHTYAPKKFERKMKKEAVQVLDVRTAEEYKQGHLPGALLMDVNSPDFKEKVAQLDKSKTYLVYCKSGRRSEKALKILYNAGYQNAYHLKGGYLNWKGETVE